MTLKRSIFFGCALLANFVLGQTPRSNSDSLGARGLATVKAPALQLIIQQGTTAPKEQDTLELKVTNVRNTDVVFGRGGYDQGLMAIVRDRHGTVVELNMSGKSLANQGPYAPARRTVVLSPSQTDTKKLRVSDFVDLRPGEEYSITVFWSIWIFGSEDEILDWRHWTGETGHFLSNTINFKF